MNTSNVGDVLRELVKTNRDGEKGYSDAAEHAKSADLKAFFRQQGSERARFATQLEAELRRLGEEVKKEGHVSGALHRAWIDVKQTLGGGDHALLESVEQGEDAAEPGAFWDHHPSQHPRGRIEHQGECERRPHVLVQAVDPGRDRL